MHSVALHEYISSLREKYKKKPKLDYISLNILEQFAWEKYISAYDVYKKLRSPLEGFYRKMAYKNVNKRVHELLLFGLIEKISPKENVNKRKAIYYQLTEYGIYRLFLDRLSSVVISQFNLRKTRNISINMLTFFHNYQNNALFELFVYSYFEKRTLFAIWNYLFFDLYGYLGECCRRIEPKLKHSDISIGEPMFSLERDPEQDDYKSLLQYLKVRFNVKEIFKVEKSNDEAILTIFAPLTEIRLDKNKREVIIFSTANGKYEEFEYGLYSLGSKILAMHKRASEESLEEISDNAKKDLEDIIYNLVYTLVCEDPQRKTEFAYYSKVLSEDKKFMETVEQIYSDKHNRFERGYKILKSII